MTTELVFLHVVHIVSILLLTAFTFVAFSAPAETRRTVLMFTGVTALLVLLTGFRMLQELHGLVFPAWIIVKFVCWLGLSALSGIGYRRREKAGVLMLIAVVLLTVAVTMVYAYGKGA
jgi:hypothetical protein